ncbi:GUN4-like family [Planktothrix serta PCC 8927]|uniref:non-specific serine/threonine protein kinase n=1 Tax=Planktothrix serta PCC 8927 TaxID=671068 RepID=A0A7Z9E4C4_9CYAN|nr:serine/threonine-protein kinase [Planktothrix serta]VXD25608.1 GUN4-like family [Planktothrix serta PCC 8927]
MAWQPGTKLYGDRYTIIKKLKEGGFGITFLARNRKGTEFVIKTLRDQILTDPDFIDFRDKYLRDFKDEATRLAVCRHPHIVEIENVFREGSLPCIVMEYIAGENLWELVRGKGAFAEAEAVRYIQQIGNALIVVHDKGLLHRDIKPQNIMKRDRKSEAVLIDFGIAREFIPNVTQTHTPAFTHGFAPIEQYDEQAHRGEYTDVYALSATLYHLLSGKVPNPAFMRNVRDSLQPLNQVVNVSNRVHKAVMKGLEIQPDKRPQSVEEWLEILIDNRVIPTPMPTIPQLVVPSTSTPLETVPSRYQKLQQLLAAGQWKEADQETATVMLQVAGREEDGYLNVDSINNFPCEDLRTIDQLWVKYSMSRFGFSVQKKIWLEFGGKVDYETECKLGDRVGWRKNGSWMNHHDLTFTLQAPTGHLPAFWGLVRGVLDVVWLMGLVWGCILSRQEL